MSFESDIVDFANKTGRSINQVMRATIIEIGTEIIRKTPRDTGRAKNSWMFTQGKADSSSTRGASRGGSAALANLNAVVAQLDNTNLYITNNIPYVQYLEYGSESTSPAGHSIQAPAGMVRITVAKYKKTLQKKVRRLK